MPREAPVTSAILPARGGVVIGRYSYVGPCAGLAVCRRYRRSTVRSSARFGQQRQLPWPRCLIVAVGERGRIVAGEAVVGELRARRIALLDAHGTVDAVDRQEGKRIRADELAHALEIMSCGE